MEELFVKTDKKRRLDKNTYTREQVTDPSFTFDYGRIVPPGYIVFDFDEQPYINIMTKIVKNSNYKCRILKTTKGYHFMFKTTLNTAKDHIKEFNWVGLKCDVKACGIKENKQSYQSIRVNGVTREEELINTTDFDDIDYAPKWMYILDKKQQQDLTVDQTGGRNNLFHSQLMIKAKKAGFSYDEYVEMANVINDYVLTEPLDQEELNTAIRPEEWDNLEIGEDKLTPYKMAEDLANHFNCIIGGDTLAFYDDRLERYNTDINVLQAYMQKTYGTSKSFTIKNMEEVIDQMNVLLKDNLGKYQYQRNQEYVLCNKQLVSTWRDDVKPNTRTVYTDVYYPYEIMTKEEFDNFDGRAKSFMKEISCDNPIVEQVIWECIGCMLAPSKTFGKIFIWYGSGANGKSLLLKIVNIIMGNLMTHANILNINDKFALEPVISGVCNVTDDVGITTLKETGVIKSLVDGTAIEVNRKFKKSIWWEPNSQFIMCCNEIPRIADTSKGMIRRLAFIPFDMQLRDDQLDRMLYHKIKSDINNLRYIMTGGIFAHRNAVSAGHLTTLEKQKELENDFIAENQDNIQSFYEYMLEEYNDDIGTLCRFLDGKTTEEIYAKYKKWCEEMIMKPEQPKTFTRQFSKRLPVYMSKKVMSIGGVKINCYRLNK